MHWLGDRGVVTVVILGWSRSVKRTAETHADEPVTVTSNDQSQVTVQPYTKLVISNVLLMKLALTRTRDRIDTCVPRGIAGFDRRARGEGREAQTEDSGSTHLDLCRKGVTRRRL